MGGMDSHCYLSVLVPKQAVHGTLNLLPKVEIVPWIWLTPLCLEFLEQRLRIHSQTEEAEH